jgi:hypothetical protein
MSPGTPGGVAITNPARYQYPYYFDLTPYPFVKMREIARSDKAAACRLVGGNLRNKLVGSTGFTRAKSITTSALS